MPETLQNLISVTHNLCILHGGSTKDGSRLTAPQDSHADAEAQQRYLERMRLETAGLSERSA